MTQDHEQEHDFALIVDGVPELNDEVMNALFEAGCDDATFCIRYGRVYAEFSRAAASLKDAVLSAIQNIHQAGIGASVLRVDECDLVTQADIARRINRTRQQVHQYITGKRGPGGFPSPECHLSEGAPLWAWCTVSFWLAENGIIRPEEGWNAQAIATINDWLNVVRHFNRDPELARGLREIVNVKN